MGLSFQRLCVVQRGRKKSRRTTTRRRRVPEIPMDVVMVEILTRLPARSLMRFKCVSKLWSSFICSRFFSNRCLITLPSPRLFMCLDDLWSRYETVILSLAPSPATDTSCSSFVVDHHLTISKKGSYISQNLGGFMCYSRRRLRIYNPATRQLVILPYLKSNNLAPAREVLPKTHNYFFGHDPVNDQYKVICSIAPNINIMPEHWVFVLKGGGSWRMAPTPPSFRPHVPDKRGAVCINGVIYYLASADLRNSYVLVSFHIKSEEFQMIQLPSAVGMFQHVCLIEHVGKVTISDKTDLRDKGMLHLWTADDAGNKEWSMKTLVLRPSQLHLINNNKNVKFFIKGTTQSGKVFLIPRDLFSPFYILCYDIQSNQMRKIDVRGIPKHWFLLDIKDRRFDFMFLDQSETVFHLET